MPRAPYDPPFYVEPTEATTPQGEAVTDYIVFTRKETGDQVDEVLANFYQNKDAALFYVHILNGGQPSRFE